MMRLFVFCVLILSSLSAFSQPDSIAMFLNLGRKVCNEGDAAYYRQAFRDGQNWVVKDYYFPARTIRMTGMFSDDSLKTGLGLFTYYHPNGAIQQRGAYLKGKKAGVWKSWHRNGQIKDSAYYKAGLPVRFYEWDKNGVLLEESLYDPEGTGRGVVRRFHRNGQLADYGITTEGALQDSTWSFYDDQGRVSEQEFWVKGELKGFQCYDTLGQAMSSCDTLVLPDFIGGEKERLAFLNNNLVWPSNIGFKVPGTGRIAARFHVDKNGNVSDIEIVKSFHPDFDRSAKDALCRMPRMKPGLRHNRVEECDLTQYISYRSED